MTNKQFNKQVFDGVDNITRIYVIQHMESKGITFHDNPDKYGIDLISDGGILLEVEQKAKAWKGHDFPFKTIHVLQRKEKWVNKGMIFAMVNEDFSRIAIISNKMLKQYMVPENLIEVPNSAVESDEYMYDIPLTAFIFDDMVNDYKQKINDLLMEEWDKMKEETKKHRYIAKYAYYAAGGCFSE